LIDPGAPSAKLVLAPVRVAESALTHVDQDALEKGAESARKTEGRAGTCQAQFALALVLACAWVVFSVWVSQPWLRDLGALTHPLAALVALTFVAYVPGFMNAFLLGSLVLEPRPQRWRRTRYPAVTVLIAAYQEEVAVVETLKSVRDAGYPGDVELLVLDDGSSDGTSAMVDYCQAELFSSSPGVQLRLLGFGQNRGKARTLNSGLEQARHDLIVTIDADTRLEPGSLTALVDRLLSDPPETVAVAGAVLVGNPHESLMAGAQQWDYFHGIAAVKRMQSMYGGTLVAQGAFSIYRRQALLDIGGWPDTVGEDIVLTWALLSEGHRVGYAADAIAWTHAPPGFAELARQRKRWARGMIEALTHHKSLLFQARLRTMFIWWNLLFISLDLVFTFVFLPGLVLALFGIYWLAGPITLLVLPLAALWNLVIFRIQTRMLKRAGIRMERSLRGFVFFALAYPLLMQPVSLWGYAAEMSGRKKEWGGT
jgi:biofilm PGA synthesis N-glycosyltransferase PgaC